MPAAAAARATKAALPATVQEYRGFQFVSHRADSANQNVIIMLGTKNQKRSPYFLHRLQHSNGTKDRLIPSETFKICDGVGFIDHERLQLQLSKAKYNHLNVGIRLQSPYISTESAQYVKVVNVRKEAELSG